MLCLMTEITLIYAVSYLMGEIMSQRFMNSVGTLGKHFRRPEMFGSVRLCSGRVARKLPGFRSTWLAWVRAGTKGCKLNRRAVQCSTNVACDSVLVLVQIEY